MSKQFDTIVPNEYILNIKDDYLQVHSNGVKTLEFATTLWTEVARVCQSQNIHRVLGIALTSDPLKIEDAKGLVPLFKELGLDKEYKIAWVELNPEYYDACLFAESLLFSNGVNAKFFYEVERARNWLLKDQEHSRQSSDSH